MGGAELPKHLVERDIWDDIEYIRPMEVHVRVDESFTMIKFERHRHTLGHHHKSDTKNRQIRARFVAQETKRTTLDVGEQRWDH